MKSIILRSVTMGGEKAKQIITQYDSGIILIEKYILGEPGKTHNPHIGGSVIIKSTDNYVLWYHWYSMKLETLDVINQFINS